jgi:hypothetical protein
MPLGAPISPTIKRSKPSPSGGSRKKLLARSWPVLARLVQLIESHIADLHSRQATSTLKELSSLVEFIGLALHGATGQAARPVRVPSVIVSRPPPYARAAIQPHHSDSHPRIARIGRLDSGYMRRHLRKPAHEPRLSGRRTLRQVRRRCQLARPLASRRRRATGALNGLGPRPREFTSC